jgi:hypothetical protein
MLHGGSLRQRRDNTAVDCCSFSRSATSDSSSCTCCSNYTVLQQIEEGEQQREWVGREVETNLHGASLQRAIVLSQLSVFASAQGGMSRTRRHGLHAVTCVAYPQPQRSMLRWCKLLMLQQQTLYTQMLAEACCTSISSLHPWLGAVLAYLCPCCC